MEKEEERALRELRKSGFKFDFGSIITILIILGLAMVLLLSFN